MEISTDELQQIIESTARFTIREYQASIGAKDKFISQSKAWNLYGRSRVNMWVRLGRVHPIKNGEKINSKLLFSKNELELVDNLERISSPDYHRQNDGDKQKLKIGHCENLDI